MVPAVDPPLFSHSEERLEIAIVLWYTYPKYGNSLYVQVQPPQGDGGCRLRQKKFALLAKLPVPEDGLPGSLSLSYRRCGKPTVTVPKGRAPSWQLTYMEKGKKRVETNPGRMGGGGP